MKDNKLGNESSRWRGMFDVGSTVVMIALALVIVWQGRARLAGTAAGANGAMEATVPEQPIEIGTSEVLGAPTAPLAIVEYSDYECPSCAQFARDTEPLLVKEFVETGKAMLVFKHFPLASHPNARPAAIAAWCAGREHKFREMHSWMFRVRGLQEADILSRAMEIGLDMAGFAACRQGDEAGKQVDADRAQGAAIGVPGTPTFFVGRVSTDRRVQVTHALVGMKPIEELRSILEGLLGR
jgi:protein-disulfide isomerase